MNPLPDFPGDVDPYARIRADQIAMAVVPQGMYTVPMIVLNKPYVRIVGPAAIVVELAPEFTTVYTFYGTPVPDEVREALSQAGINPEYEVLHSPRNPAAYVLNLPFAWPHPEDSSARGREAERVNGLFLVWAFFTRNLINHSLPAKATERTAALLRGAFEEIHHPPLSEGMKVGLDLLESIIETGKEFDLAFLIGFTGLIVAEIANPGRGHEALQE